MNRKLLLTLFLLSVFSSKAQNWEWAKNITHGAQAIGTSIGTDQNGNIYVTGNTSYYTGGGGGYYYELFWKLDGTGNILWVDTLDIVQTKSVTDLNGFTYIASGTQIEKFNNEGQKLWSSLYPIGSIQGICFSPNEGILTCGYGYILDTARVSISRFDTNGICLWSKIPDIPAAAYALAYDKDGNSYVAASGYPDSSTGNSGILFKYDKNGNFIYSKIIPHYPNDILIDNNNNIYVTGWFSIYSININGNIYPGDPTTSNQYLIKYDQQGNVLWYKIIKKIYDVSIDSDMHGNVFLVGSFFLDMEVDSIHLTSIGHDIFIMKTDSSGNIAWYDHSIASTSTSCYPGDIHVNSKNEVFITGAVNGVHTFGLYSTTQSNTYTDLLIAKISQPTPISPAPEPHFPKIKEEGQLIITNPSSTYPTINFSSPQKNSELLLSIKNSLGQTVYSERKKDYYGDYITTLNLSGQSSGIYFVEVVCGEERRVKKIVVD